MNTIWVVEAQNGLSRKQRWIPLTTVVDGMMTVLRTRAEARKVAKHLFEINQYNDFSGGFIAVRYRAAKYTSFEWKTIYESPK